MKGKKISLLIIYIKKFILHQICIYTEFQLNKKYSINLFLYIFISKNIFSMSDMVPSSLFGYYMCGNSGNTL